MMIEGSLRRFVAAVCLVIIAVFVLTNVVFPAPDICDTLENPILRWLAGCKDVAGGGGGGAG